MYYVGYKLCSTVTEVLKLLNFIQNFLKAQSS